MKETIGLIGAGNMGSAILKGVKDKYQTFVCEADSKRAIYAKKIFKTTPVSLENLLKNSDIVILAVKPQGFDELLSQIKPSAAKRHLFVSIAAGITTSYIEKRLGKVRVVRTMPNLPAQVKQGITAVCAGKFASVSDLKIARDIFDTVGQTVVVDEKMMDTVTAVSGSGPAYVFYFVENFLKAAQSLGFKDDIALKLINQTLKGSLALLENSSESAGVLRQRVTSKGGTTEAALKELEKGKSAAVFAAALKSAQRRAKELSR